LNSALAGWVARGCFKAEDGQKYESRREKTLIRGIRGEFGNLLRGGGVVSKIGSPWARKGLEKTATTRGGRKFAFRTGSVKKTWKKGITKRGGEFG